MYMYTLYSDLAIRRGVVTEMSSNITPENDEPEKDSKCFVARILKGFYEPNEFDYVVELSMDKDK